MAKSSKLRTAALPANTVESAVDISLQGYVALLDAVPYGFVLVDKMGVIQACNAAGRVMFQYRNIDIVAMPVDQLLDKPEVDNFLENLQCCLQMANGAGHHTNLQSEGLKKDGTTFPVEIHLKIIRLPGRELIGCSFRDISRRRCNEYAIRKKEKNLQLVLHSAELWNWEYDCRTRVISYEIQNSTASGFVENNFQLDFDRWINLIYPDDKKAVLKSWSTLLTDGPENFEFEYRLKRTGGNWDWIYSCEHEVQRGNDGQPVKVSGANLNISQRKYAEERLQEKDASLVTIEKRLRLAQESSGVASWEWDLELKCITYCSDNFACQYGLDSAEKISTLEEWLNAIYPDDRERVMKGLDEAGRDVKSHFSMEYRVVWPDQSMHWLAFRASMICDDDNPVRVAGISFDITARKHGEEELKESEERFKSAFNHSAIPMLLVSNGDGIVRVNEAMCQLTDYDEEELLTMKLVDLVHPEDRAEAIKQMGKAIKGNIEQFSTSSRYLTKTDTTKWVSVNVACIKDKQGGFRYAVVQLKDITEEHILSSKLNHEATHDSLTGLANRHEFENSLVNVLQTIKKELTQNALAYIDLDQFKVINDTCGHAAGDELLLQISALIRRNLRKHDMIARLGGDEFGVFMERCDLEQAKVVIGKILVVIRDFRFVWEDKSFNVTMSCGLVAVTEESRDVTEVLQQADAACYAAKDAGRNRVHVYHPQDEELSRRSGEMQWVARITKALEQDRFQLYCQPIAAIEIAGSGRLYYEVLVRLQEENGDLVPPGAFLPAAERYGLSTRIDKWVIEKTLAWLKLHPEHVDNLDLCCINLSGLSLGDHDVLAFIENQLVDNKIPAEKICFEITETAAIANLGNATDFIRTLRQHGCLFALDDFGSGLSSFAYLKTLQVDILKIDGSFVRDIVTSPVDLAMVRSINEIGKVLGKRTTAEFVENNEILELLRQIGVDRAQGYGISRPIPLNDLSTLDK